MENTPNTEDSPLSIAVEDGTIGIFNTATADYVGIPVADWPAVRDKIDAICQPKDSIQSEVDQIWGLTPRTSRARSSRKQLLDKWRQHRRHAPDLRRVLASLSDWADSRPWREGYAEGIHRWVQNHKWEVEPEHAAKPSGFTSNSVGI